VRRPMPPRFAEAVGDLASDVRDGQRSARASLGVQQGRHLVEHRERGEKGERRDPHRAHTADRRDREPADGRPDDARRAVGAEEDRVRVGELVLPDERRDDAEVGRDAPKHLDGAEQEPDDEDELHREEAEDR
jgi:hypothetical protein